MKIYREMVFKDCKLQKIVIFSVEISRRLYKIVKSCGPLVLWYDSAMEIASYLNSYT